MLEVKENVVVGTSDGDRIPVADTRAVKRADDEADSEGAEEAVTDALDVSDFVA